MSRVNRISIRIQLMLGSVVFVLTAALWLPFGFKQGPWTDGWANFLYVEPFQGFQFWDSRPLAMLPTYVAHLLTPESFLGYNLVLLILLWLKTSIFLCLLINLGVRRDLAFVISVLYGALSIDSAIFWLGALNVHFAVLSYLIASNLLIANHASPKASRLIFSSVFLLISLETYEAGLLLAIATPLLLRWAKLDPARSTNKKIIVNLSVWYFVIGLKLIHLLILLYFHQGYEYQASILSIPDFQDFILCLIQTYGKHLWFVGDHSFRAATAFSPISGVVGVFFFAILYWLAKPQRGEEQVDVVTSVPAMIWLGVSIVALGTAPYSITSLNHVSFRTYFYSGMGGVMAVCAVLFGVCQKLESRFRRCPARLIFSVLCAVIYTISFTSILEQHEFYVNGYQTEIVLTRSLLQALPGISPGTCIILLDKSHTQRLRQICVGSSTFLSFIIRLIYRDSSILTVLFSEQDTVTWGDFHELCTFSEESVKIIQRDKLIATISYGNLIVASYRDDSTIRVEQDIHLLVPGGQPPDYAADKLILKVPYPSRYYSMLVNRFDWIALFRSLKTRPR